MIGTVSGSKSLLPGNEPQTAGICTYGALFFAAQRSANAPVDMLSYTATFTAGGQQYTDHGLSHATFNHVPVVPQSDNFNEDFVSQQLTTIPVCDQNSQIDQNQILNDQGCMDP